MARSLVQLIISANSTAATGAVNALNNALSGLNSTAAKVGAALTGALAGISVANFFNSAIDSAANFEKQLDIVASKLSGDPASVAEAMKLVRAESERLGAVTQFTATEAAQGFQILVQAGLSASDAIATLPTVLNVAIGQNLDLAESAKIVTDTISQMNLGFSDAARVADVFTIAANLANTTVQELQAGIAVAGQSARRSGQDFEQTVAILDTLAREGLRSAEAGTALRNLFNELRDPASKARVELAKLGITSGELTTVIAELGKLGPQANGALAGFTVEAQRAAGILINQGVPAVEEFTNRLRNVQGAAAETAKVAGDNLRGALAALGSAWDALQRTIVNQDFLDAIRRQIDELTGRIQDAIESGVLDKFRQSIIDAFENAARAVKQFVDSFDFEQALNSLGDFANQTTAKLDEVIGVVSVFANSLKLLFNAFTAGVESIGAAFTGLLAQINKGVAVALSGLEKIGLASTAMVAEFEQSAEAYQSISDAFVTAIEQDAKDIRAAWDGVTKAFDSGSENIRRSTDTAADSAENMADRIQSAVELIDIPPLSELQELPGTFESIADSADVAAESTQKIGEVTQEVIEAYRTLKIDSSRQLEETAQKAREAFEIIRDAGTETADDLRGAFLEYARAVIIANETSERTVRNTNLELLRQEASQLNILDTLDRMIKRNDKRIGLLKQENSELQKQVDASQSLVESTESRTKSLEKQRSEKAKLNEEEASALEIAEIELEIAEARKNQAEALAVAKRDQARAADELVDALQRQAIADGQVNEEEAKAIQLAKLSASEKRDAANIANRNLSLAKEEVATAKERVKELEKQDEAQEKASKSGGKFASVLDAMRKSLSPEIWREFQTVVGGVAQRTRFATEEAERLAQQIAVVRETIEFNLSFGIRSVFSPVIDAFHNLYEEQLQLQLAAENFTVALERQAETGRISLGELEQAATFARSAVGRLGQEELNRLNSAIDVARQKLEQLQDLALAASESAELALLRAQGNDQQLRIRELEIEQEKELASLEALRLEAQTSGQREIVRQLDEAIRKRKEALELSLRQIDAEGKSRIRNTDQTRNTATTSTGSGGSITINQNFGFLVPDKQQLENAARQLKPVIGRLGVLGA